MSAKRDLSLSPRKENQRDAQPIQIPVQFSLCEILHHFTESMISIKAQFEVADTLRSSNDIVGCEMIWRSQVVLAEGLLDFYIHEMSKYCLFKMFTGQWQKSAQYANLMVPMNIVERGLASADSKDWFYSFLNDRFSREVYLSKECMKDQLNLIGIAFVPVMVAAFPNPKNSNSGDVGAAIVSELFKRRNQIAHQNDRSHASSRQADITKEYVEDYINKIELIVNTIHDVAETRDANERNSVKVDT